MARSVPRSVGLAVAAALAPAAIAACTIIVQPGGPSPTPTPIPVPLTCVESGSQASAHVIFDVRVERSTVNLAPRYQALLEQTVMALATARIMTTLAAVVRLDERPTDPAVLAAWGCSLDDPRTLTPEQVLGYWATEASLPESPVGCAVDPLVGVGADLGAVVTQYPPALPGTSGRRVFGSAPDLVLVIHVDGAPRRTGFEDPGCGGARAPARRWGAGPRAGSATPTGPRRWIASSTGSSPATSSSIARPSSSGAAPTKASRRTCSTSSTRRRRRSTGPSRAGCRAPARVASLRCRCARCSPTGACPRS